VVYIEIAYPHPDFDVSIIGAKKIEISKLEDDKVEIVGPS
jgi:hypothetical protein